MTCTNPARSGSPCTSTTTSVLSRNVAPPSKGFWVSADAYVFKDGTVSWQPAVAVNRIVMVAVLGRVAVAWMLAGGPRPR
jgi:hypothetical protein